MKRLFITFSVLLFVYMLWPGVGNISKFRPLPNSAKSTLEGDTIQIPNVSAYFSENFRNFVIPFYFKDYQRVSYLPFPPLRLNHAPEYSWTVIKKPTDTTYLEEFVYPLRDSLYVNGFEVNRPDGSVVFWGGPKLDQDDKYWSTKATLRLYTSNVFTRLLVWGGIILAISSLYKLGRSIVTE